MAPSLITVPVWVAAVVVLLTATAAEADWRTRRISNRLTGPALLAALIAHTVVGGRAELSSAMLGALLAGGVLIPGWLLGWMGAGDVKLMAAVGAWLTYPAGLVATLATLIAGGVMAVIVALRHRALSRALRNAAAMAVWTPATLAAQAAAPPPVTTGIRFPFAAAILAGALISLWVRI